MASVLVQETWTQSHSHPNARAVYIFQLYAGTLFEINILYKPHLYKLRIKIAAIWLQFGATLFLCVSVLGHRPAGFERACATSFVTLDDIDSRLFDSDRENLGTSRISDYRLFLHRRRTERHGWLMIYNGRITSLTLTKITTPNLYFVCVKTRAVRLVEMCSNVLWRLVFLVTLAVALAAKEKGNFY